MQAQAWDNYRGWASLSHQLHEPYLGRSHIIAAHLLIHHSIWWPGSNIHFYKHRYKISPFHASNSHLLPRFHRHLLDYYTACVANSAIVLWYGGTFLNNSNFGIVNSISPIVYLLEIYYSWKWRHYIWYNKFYNYYDINNKIWNKTQTSRFKAISHSFNRLHQRSLGQSTRASVSAITSLPSTLAYISQRTS